MSTDFIQLIRHRRSIRTFTKNPISAEHMELLKETALRAPTSRNLHPWEFRFITDPGTLYALSLCKPHGAAFLASAPLGIVVYADETRSDVWIEDCSIASIMLQLTAQSLGLGSCWLQVRNRKAEEGTDSESYVRKLLKLPEKMRILSIIGIGYPAEVKEPIPAEDLLQDKIH